MRSANCLLISVKPFLNFHFHPLLLNSSGPYHLTIRASLAPRWLLFLLKGPEGPFRAPRRLLFLLKGPKDINWTFPRISSAGPLQEL